ARGTSRSRRRIASRRSDSLRSCRRVVLQSLQHLATAALYVQADEIRGHLFAHPGECDHEREADFAAQQPGNLNGGAECQRVLWPKMQDGEKKKDRKSTRPNS